MRRLLTHILLSTLFVVAVASAAVRAQSTPQKSDPPPPAETPFNKSRVEGDTFSNDFFGISFNVPKGWTVFGVAENKAIMDAGRQIVEEGASEKKKAGIAAGMSRTGFLINAAKHPPGTADASFNALLLCMAERIPTAVIKTGADYVSSMQRIFEGTQAKMEFTGPVRTKTVGVVAFTVADVKTTTGRGAAAQRYYVMISKGYALAIVYTYFDDADLKTFDEVIASIKFK